MFFFPSLNKKIFNKDILKYIFLLLLIIFLIFSPFIKKFVKLEKFSNNESRKNNAENNKLFVSKIIHQTAPSDKKKWHPLWFECQESWKKHFPSPEYKYVMWTDEDLDEFVKKEFKFFYNTYASYDANIKRIDVARYLILYKYGGIYADMDYKCFKNFYSYLPGDKISISESPFKSNEYLQNALMASPKGDSFWLDVIVEAEKRKGEKSILYSTGPNLVSDVYKKNENKVNVLPIALFNPHKDSDEFKDDSKLYAKHLVTYSWKENKK